MALCLTIGFLMHLPSVQAEGYSQRAISLHTAVDVPQRTLGSSQPAITLMQAYELALEKDLSYAAALDTYRAMQEKVPQAKAAMRPNISLSAGLNASVAAPNSNSRLEETVNEASDTSATTQSTSDSSEISNSSTRVNGSRSPSRSSSSTSSDSVSHGQSNEQIDQSTALGSRQINARNVRSLGAESAINLTWPVYSASLDRQLEQSRLIEDQALLQLNAARQDVALRLARAYFDVLLGRENLSALGVQKAAIDQQLAVAQSSFEEGVVTIADVREAQAKRDAVVGQEVALRNTLRVKRTVLQALIGVRADNVQQLRINEFLTQFALPLGGANYWVSLAQEQSYEVQIENLGLRIAQKELDKQTAVYKPTVDFVANLGMSRSREVSRTESGLAQSEQTDGFNQSESERTSDTSTSSSTNNQGLPSTTSNTNTQSTTQSSTQTYNQSSTHTNTSRPASRSRSFSKQWDASIGIRLNVPLYDGGMTSSRVREALALQSKKARDLQRVQAEAALAAETAYLEAEGFIAEAQALRAAETSGEVALESNTLGFEVGLRMNSDVLNAQQQLFTVRRDLMKAQVEALLATLRLKASAGALVEVEMGRLSQWLR